MEDTKPIRRDFHLAAWGVGLGVHWGFGVKKSFLKFNQSWCVSYLHEWHMQRHNILCSRPVGAFGRGQKVKYHLILITKSITKIFKPNFVCLLKNERYKTYRTGFSIDCQGHAQGVGLGGTVGGLGSISFFPNSTRVSV